MLRAIRRTRLASLFSLATLVCVVSLSGSSLVHSDTDDTICNPVLVLHDHSADRIGGRTNSTPFTPEHCAICHWQTLRTVQADVPAAVPETEGLRHFAAAGLSVSSATLSRQPARAPPAA